MKISEVNSIVEKSTAKIIEAAEVRADLLAVAAHIPKGQRKNTARSLSAYWQNMTVDGEV